MSEIFVFVEGLPKRMYCTAADLKRGAKHVRPLRELRTAIRDASMQFKGTLDLERAQDCRVTFVPCMLGDEEDLLVLRVRELSYVPPELSESLLDVIESFAKQHLPKCVEVMVITHQGGQTFERRSRRMWDPVRLEALRARGAFSES